MDFGSEFGAVQSGRAFRNPGISLCHVAFRSAALLIYLFGGLFSSSFIGVFVAVVLLLSIDFWTVKNVTGRIMVSLKNEIRHKDQRCCLLVRICLIKSTIKLDNFLSYSGWIEMVELY